MVDLDELQRRCRQLDEEGAERRRRIASRPPPPPPPKEDKWAFLKDYPGQWLSEEEFGWRLLEWQAKRDENRYLHTSAYEENGTKRKSPWKRKMNRRP